MKIKSRVAGKCLLLIFANGFIAMNSMGRKIYFKDYWIRPYEKGIEYMKRGFLFTFMDFITGKKSFVLTVNERG